MTFTWTVNAGGGTATIDVELNEFHRSAGTATYDACGGGGATACVTTSASCNAPCTGPAPTVTGNVDVVVTVIGQNETVQSVASPYNTSPSPDLEQSSITSGFAWSLSQSSGHAAAWTCDLAAGAAMMAVAFK